MGSCPCQIKTLNFLVCLLLPARSGCFVLHAAVSTISNVPAGRSASKGTNPLLLKATNEAIAPNPALPRRFQPCSPSFLPSFRPSFLPSSLPPSQFLPFGNNLPILNKIRILENTEEPIHPSPLRKFVGFGAQDEAREMKLEVAKASSRTITHSTDGAAYIF